MSINKLWYCYFKKFLSRISLNKFINSLLFNRKEDEKRMRRYIHCKNEQKIEEILKYLLDKEIDFEIIGRQALLIFVRSEEELNNFLGDGWFDVEEMDSMESFPRSCWEFGGRASSGPFGGNIPDSFSPVQTPPQEPKP